MSGYDKFMRSIERARPDPVEPIKELKKDLSKREVPREMPREMPREAPWEAPTKVPWEAPRQVPWEAPRQVPWEAPNEVTWGAPTPVPWEAPNQMPWEAPKQVHWEAPKQEPWEAPKQVPWEAPRKVPWQALREVPRKVVQAVPVKQVVGDQCNFYAATQGPGESYTQFAIRLRTLAANCNLPNLEETLRYRFVMGMLPGPERSLLFTVELSQPLPLARAVEFVEGLRYTRGVTKEWVPPPMSLLEPPPEPPIPPSDDWPPPIDENRPRFTTSRSRRVNHKGYICCANGLRVRLFGGNRITLHDFEEAI